jgi:uncharacterized protein (TIGR02677 family)
VGDREPRWLGLSRQLFSFNAAERRDLYIAVLVCFADAPFEPALNLEQLQTRLRDSAPELAGGDQTQITSVLRTLTEEWGLLDPSRDESATYRDPAQFRNRTLQWSLTSDGLAVVAAMDAAAEALASVASLQPAAIDAIARALSEVADLAADPDGDDAQMHVRLHEAEQHHRTLVENLRSFTRDVQRLLGRADTSDADLADAKNAILNYLSRYVVDAEGPARAVAVQLDRLAAIGVETVAERAARGSNPAPGLGGDDPFVRALAMRRDNLAALRSWFVGEHGHAAQFSQLLPRGLDAILRFMRVLELRREQRRRAASLADDFRALARVLAAAPTRADAHRVWNAATALQPARHHHLLVDDTTPVEAGQDAAANPAVPLEVELRRSPRSPGRPGRDGRVPDTRAARAARQREQAAALADQSRRRQVLHHPAATRLSALPFLDDEQFDDLLDLLGQALGAPLGDDGHRRSISADGQVEVVVYPHRPWSLNRVLLRSGDGTMEAPDLPISIRLLGVDVLSGAVGGDVDGVALTLEVG